MTDPKKLLMLAMLALAAAAIVFLTMDLGGFGRSSPPGLERISIAGETFDLEIACDDPSRANGLMNRTTIPEQGGMLFVFPSHQVRVQNFWMKNCPIDIDIIYLDPRGFVTATHRMRALPRLEGESDAAYETRAQLSTYSSAFPAQFAIELKAGTLDRLKVKVDDRIALDLDRLKGLAR